MTKRKTVQKTRHRQHNTKHKKQKTLNTLHYKTQRQNTT